MNNYSTYCNQHLARFIPSPELNSVYCHTMQNLGKAIIDAPKFLLPVNGKVGEIEISATTIELVKLPYPTVVFEYPLIVQNTKTEVVVTVFNTKAIHDFYRELGVEGTDFLATFHQDVVADDSIYIAICFRVDVPGMPWMAPFYLTQVQLSTAFLEPSKVNMRHGVLSPVILEELASGWHADKSVVYAALGQITSEAVFTVTKALACLNARNVTTIVVPPNEKANKKRIRNGKPPYCAYHVLDIFLPPHLRELRSTPQKLNAVLNDVHVPTALHSVRGHFKRRKTGLFWWSPFMRGSAAQGVVTKDYNIKNV